MGEFTFPEIRRRISSSAGWMNNSQSLCEPDAIAEVNQVINKLGGVKSVEQSFCNQEISQQNTMDKAENRSRGFSFFSSFAKPSALGDQRSTSISEAAASKQLSANTNPSTYFVTSSSEK